MPDQTHDRPSDLVDRQFSSLHPNRLWVADSRMCGLAPSSTVDEAIEVHEAAVPEIGEDRLEVLPQLLAFITADASAPWGGVVYGEGRGQTGGTDGAASAGLSSCGVGFGTGCQVEPFDLLPLNGDLQLSDHHRPVLELNKVTDQGSIQDAMRSLAKRVLNHSLAPSVIRTGVEYRPSACPS